MGHGLAEDEGHTFRVRRLQHLNRREDNTGELRSFLASLQELVDLLLADVDGWTQSLFGPGVKAEETRKAGQAYK